MITQSCQEMNGFLSNIEGEVDAAFLPLPGHEKATGTRIAKLRGARGQIVTEATDLTSSHGN